jgi:hypothetical protein
MVFATARKLMIVILASMFAGIVLFLASVLNNHRQALRKQNTMRSPFSDGVYSPFTRPTSRSRNREVRDPRCLNFRSEKTLVTRPGMRNVGTTGLEPVTSRM